MPEGSDVLQCCLYSLANLETSLNFVLGSYVYTLADECDECRADCQLIHHHCQPGPSQLALIIALGCICGVLGVVVIVLYGGELWRRFNPPPPRLRLRYPNAEAVALMGGAATN
jgi:hypothetical protein